LLGLHQFQAFFVARPDRSTPFQRRYSRPGNRALTNVLCDQTGMLTVYTSRREYPGPRRRVVIEDGDGNCLTFLTNNFVLTPELTAALHRQRWQVELFFKWIMQYLRIAKYLGTSENAVKTQISTHAAAGDADMEFEQIQLVAPKNGGTLPYLRIQASRPTAYVPHPPRTGHRPQCITRAVHTSAPISISA